MKRLEFVFNESDSARLLQLLEGGDWRLSGPMYVDLTLRNVRTPSTELWTGGFGYIRVSESEDVSL